MQYFYVTKKNARYGSITAHVQYGSRGVCVKQPYKQELELNLQIQREDKITGQGKCCCKFKNFSCVWGMRGLRNEMYVLLRWSLVDEYFSTVYGTIVA
jgi:hypothetical protein